MNNEPGPHQPAPEDDLMQLRDESHLDFFQSIRHRTIILPLAGRIRQLIEEYQGTAKRVGADFGELVLLKLVDSLMRESLEEPSPLQGFSNEDPIDRFLAESLYHEILEERALQMDRSALFSPEDWRASLENVADSFLEPATPFPVATER